MFQMKFEDVSADITLNAHINSNEDESADFFSFFTNEPQKNTYKCNNIKNNNNWDYFSDCNMIASKKEESFNQQNGLQSLNNNNNNHRESYLQQEESCFYYNQQEQQQQLQQPMMMLMECENDVNKYNREYLQYPIMPLFSQNSAFKQESKIYTNLYKQQNILIDNQSILNARNVTTINWNKSQKYIEISYNMREQYLMEKKMLAKQACSESQIETVEPSINNYDVLSAKNHENSITEQEEFSQLSNENSLINMNELSVNLYLNKSYQTELYENHREFIGSDLFVFKESDSQKTAFLQSSFFSEAFIEFLSNNMTDIKSLIFSSSTFSEQLSSGFGLLKNENNKRSFLEISEYIFSNMESFSSGQLACDELFTFVTIDGFQFNAQFIQQVFPFRGQNNELQGCLIKYHFIIPEQVIQEINQIRHNQQEKEIVAKTEEEHQQEPIPVKSKGEQLQKEVQECKRKDKFTCSVKKFLYKFKYISKEKNIKKQKVAQDIYPSKTCKYRLIKH